LQDSQPWSTVLDVARIEPTPLERTHTPVYTMLRLLLGPVIRSMMNIEFTGLHYIPKKGPIIFASNHLSHFDPIFMIAGARKKLHFLAKDAHFNRWQTRFLVRATGQIRTAREQGASDALATASGVLDAGRCMGIFPEGTRSRSEQAPFLGKGKTGIARLASSHPNVPVIPVVCLGTRDFMTPNTHRFPRFWKPVRIHFGRPQTWSDWIVHPYGGDKNSAALEVMLDSDTDRQNELLRELYRRYTDQFMVTLEAMGAP